MTETMGEDTAATVIIGQQVKPGSEKQFAAWQHGVNKAAARYPGFLGAEVTPPTGLQPDWVVVYRFDSVANVQAWINSATRQDMSERGAPVPGGAADPAGRRRRRPSPPTSSSPWW